MGIQFSKEHNRFTLTTKHTMYVFDIVQGQYLRHLYYGKKIKAVTEKDAAVYSFSPYRADLDWTYSPDLLPLEFSFFGSGDFRASALRLCAADGTDVTDFSYRSHRVFFGKPDLDGLPSSRADKHTKTLEITLYDAHTACTLKLYYTVFVDEDIITRTMSLQNGGDGAVTIEKCMSMTLDLPTGDYDMISTYGSHLHECGYDRHPLFHGVQSITSRRGASSHQHNPFFALCSHNATEERGEVYGFNFVYSGSFLNEVEVDQQNTTRVTVGLGSENFAYTLEKGERFIAPEAVLTYSAYGFGTMTRNFHDFIRAHILPAEAVEKVHPVVLNTWEAVYFDINQALLLDFAEEAHKVGHDMLVMDDGWFGERHNDNAALGDWYTNARKFPEGLAPFAKAVKDKGVQFGIWVEPEMINPDSDLYRAHPDWCLHVEGREPHLSRNQLVLDMSNDAVIDYLVDTFDKTFDGVPIDYFKWDMNRHLSDVASSVAAPRRQKEVFFRHLKGAYRLLDHFRKTYPNAVIETCSGGGGRYDLGMMCYGIQIWTSDNTDPYDRTLIQSTAMMAYPAATMSCHVSDPHDDLASLDYRYKVAVGGMLGYELNILKMTDAVKAEMSRQIAEYRLFEHLMRLGDYYALVSPYTNPCAAYYYASKTGDELLLSVIEKADCKSGYTKLLKLKAAKADRRYRERYSGKEYTGEQLKKGICLTLTGDPDTAHLMYFIAL